jgi:Lrp/AsnC family transcriptional regulator, regulator for asnA, asnC and gidA
VVDTDRALKLDTFDHAIIQRLRHNGRIPFREIANELAVSEGTVRNRVNRLTEQGAMRIVAVTDPRKLGSPIDCVIGLEVDLRQIHAVAARLTEFPELRYVGIATGPFDIIIAGDFVSEKHLLDFLSQTLASIDGTKRSETSRILHTYKRLFDAVPALIPSPAEVRLVDGHRSA